MSTIGNWLKENEPRILASGVLSSIALGAVGFYQYSLNTAQEIDLSKILYLSLQLFGMNSGLVDQPQAMPIALHLARWLAPLTVMYGAGLVGINILRDDLQLLKVRKLRGHLILCGLDERCLRLIGEAVRQNIGVVVLDTVASDELIFEAKAAGAIILRESPGQHGLRRTNLSHAAFLVAASESDTANIEVLKLAKDARRTATTNQLKAYAHIGDAKLKLLMQDYEVFRINYAGFDGRIFNVYENAGRAIIRQFPPDRYRQVFSERDSAVHALIVGFGLLGQGVLVQLAKMAHYATDKKTIVTVLTDESDVRQRFEARFPSLPEVIDIRFVEVIPECVTESEFSAMHREAAFDAIYFCIEHDASQIATVAKLRSFYGENHVPFIVSLSSSLPIAQSLKEDPAIELVDPLRDAWSFEIVIGESLDRQARLIHESWLANELVAYERRVLEAKQKGTQPPKLKATMERWDTLLEEYKDGNRSQAEHLDVKLRALGLEAAPLDDARPAVDIAPDAQMLLRLAKMEHRRWNADKWMADWRVGERNDALRRHPNLVCWDRLDKETQQYDIDAVAGIPGLLKLIGKKAVRS